MEKPETHTVMQLPIDDADCVLLPHADHVQGLTYTANPQNWRLGMVQIGYSTAQNKRWMHLRMSTDNALYLLNLLEAWSAEQGLDTKRRPT